MTQIGVEKKRKREDLTSGSGGRSREDGAVLAADVILGNFHAEVPLLHTARRPLQHSPVHRLQSHPPWATGDRYLY